MRRLGIRASTELLPSCSAISHHKQTEFCSIAFKKCRPNQENEMLTISWRLELSPCLHPHHHTQQPNIQSKSSRIYSTGPTILERYPKGGEQADECLRHVQRIQGNNHLGFDHSQPLPLHLHSLCHVAIKRRDAIAVTRATRHATNPGIWMDSRCAPQLPQVLCHPQITSPR